ncbi:hypothetical protein L1887_30275 [Cichorium endivia]|nr:hypothetical protein L1887_30275 [Cichorium endivia]
MFFTKSNSLVRFLLLVCLSLTINLSSGANTISANQSLSGDHTIVSEGEQFELGFFKAGNNKLLVYDYMENGSLDTHLFREKQVLNWKTRVLTTTRGSLGYLAPEWLSGVPVTAKADVYSYGMMLFELVYGNRNAEHCEDLGSTFFPSLVANVLMEGGDILNLLDSRLNREASVEEVTKICKVACWCIQDEEDSRPTMSTVERILEGVLDVSMPPIPQIVTLFVANMGDVVFYANSPSNGSSLVQRNSS